VLAQIDRAASIMRSSAKSAGYARAHLEGIDVMRTSMSIASSGHDMSFRLRTIVNSLENFLEIQGHSAPRAGAFSLALRVGRPVRIVAELIYFSFPFCFLNSSRALLDCSMARSVCSCCEGVWALGCVTSR